MKKVLIQEVGGTSKIEQPPSKSIAFTLHLIPAGIPWYNREGKLQNVMCILLKNFTMTADTKPEDLKDFIQQMLVCGTFMGGIGCIRDEHTTFSVQEFSTNYDNIRVSLISPPVYQLVPNTFNSNENDMLVMLSAKLNKLTSLHPVSADLVEKMLEQLSIEYTHASCHIEGNPLRRFETELVVSKMLSIAEHPHHNSKRQPPSNTKVVNKPIIHLLDNQNQPVDLSSDQRLKDLSEQSYVKMDFEEVKNHKQAVELFLIKPVSTLQFSPDLPKLIHKRLTLGILASAGEYRSVDVRVSKSSFQNPSFEKVPTLMQKFMEELSQKLSNPDHPVLLAAWAHDVLVRIHPFEDGNGRTARILMNIVLIHFRYPISFWPEQIEDVYWSACELAHVGNNMSHINRIVCEAVAHSLDIYLDTYQGHLPSFSTTTATPTSTTPGVRVDKNSLFF